MKTKSLTIIFLMTIIICGLNVIGNWNFDTVEAAVNVSSIISSDTTWTKANSPYNLTGNVLVSNGVTLTIEAGATVNFNSFYIMVNGTLWARGSPADKIQFNAGSMTFTEFGTNWSEATGLGSIIENANLSSTALTIYSVSPKISNSILGTLLFTGSPTISNNIINTRLAIGVGSSSLITNNTINGDVSVSSYSFPTISNNIISGKVTVNTQANYTVISYNTILGGVYIAGGVESPLISHNTISGGFEVSGDSVTVSFNNVIGGIRDGASSITFLNNTISGSNIGIEVVPHSYGLMASFFNNTITARDTGILIPESWAVSLFGEWTDANISGNTIHNCSGAAIQVGGLTSTITRYNVVPILNNYLYGNNYAIKTGGMSTVEGNTIINNYCAIDGGGADPVRNNIVANNTLGILSGSTVEGNLIVNNQVGLDAGINIRNNTIVNNTLGIYSGFSNLSYNNIYGNGLNLNFSSSKDGNASYNWWGTTNTAAINQTIYDYKNDFTLGRVNFVPVLTAPNPAAPSANTPIPPPIIIPELQTPILIAILLTATLATTVGRLIKKKR